MNVIYPDSPVEIVGPSVFLVGPTPRSKNVPSWRPKAIEYFKEFNFEGTVMVPEAKLWPEFLNQVEWEYACLTNCSVVLAWVPRDLTTMPAFTTNVEFGYWLGKNPKKLFYGRPDNAPHTNYLDWFYKKICNRNPHNDLFQLVSECINRAKELGKSVSVCLDYETDEQSGDVRIVQK